MSSNIESFGAALRSRILHDFEESKSVSANFAKADQRRREQVSALKAGIPEGEPVTPLQKRIRGIADETGDGFEALLQALDMPSDPKDPTVAAAIQLIAPLLGQILLMETRIIALEEALAQ